MKTIIALALLTLCIIATQSVSAQNCPVLCQFGANHRFPHFTRCNRYYECISGHLFEFDCGTYEIFDIESLGCSATGRCVLNQNARDEPDSNTNVL
ncbi:hypothetical protein Bhyg_02460 [Pseudolycoriella hygida]|uniref:Chitin-binding type-2 domain-containing protein n=1 Tax=Pseudolycoriella hygida TaxID=35572 RepID=A0A9Q0ND95_9DIPT|nr:hypothetical protein Bhyg_02460 [Pseudolycoriella hygida]